MFTLGMLLGGGGFGATAWLRILQPVEDGGWLNTSIIDEILIYVFLRGSRLLGAF